jgi:methylated-DNA-protein-cysteine methyltransferase-like protein
VGSSSTFARILAVVRRIPRGSVMTYGQVAAAAGMPRGARVVGYALRGCKGAVPWQRVVGLRRKGRAHVTLKDPVGAALQRKLLEKEGVRFTRDDAIDLARYGLRSSGT